MWDFLKRKDREPLMLSCYSPNKTKWDLFVMLMATYNCFQIPLEVAFNPPGMGSGLLKFISGTIDLIFVVDICVSFRTTVLSPFNGSEIKDVKQVSQHYIRGQFTIDLLATIPFDTFAELVLGEAGLFKVLGILKLVRILRL
jgi:hypothetical protein